MRPLPIALLLVPLSAVAQPALPGAACPVTLARAPDEVREVVEAWLRAEPSCGAALEVTIVPVEGGYLLDAIDASGGRRVRVVPDAQLAGALIASWAADDHIALPPPPSDAVAEPRVPPAVLPSAEVAAGHRRALLGAVVGAEQGLRGEVDLAGLGDHVALGVAAAARIGTVRRFGEARDVAAGAYLGLSVDAARWRLRAQVGAGYQMMQLRLANTTGEIWASGTDYLFVADASMTVSREIATGWAVTGGVLVNVLPHPVHTMAASSVRTELDRVAPMAVVGVSRAL